MEPLLNSLNPSQKEAALCIDEHVRIIAGAGSGKTRVLMARIEYLIEELGVDPSHIMAITFTNKAAREMQERLSAQVGSQAERVRISTIHALCVRILREDADLLGYPKAFTIYDSEDQRAVLRTICKELGMESGKRDLWELLGDISNYHLRHISPQKALEQAVTPAMKKIAAAYARYEQTKRDMKAFDFDDLLIYAERLLRTEESVRTKWQRRLDYIHVDEFQDVDPIQYDLIRHLVREDARLAVVGDPDQTIYTWRGAQVDIILHFDNDFQPSRTILLNQNYRSTQPILSASNALIARNSQRVEKELFTQKEGGVEIVMAGGASDEEEAHNTIERMIDLHKEEGIPWKEMAILYRNNYLSRIYEKLLRQLRIPYQIYGGIRFYERAEIKDLLAYLKLLSKPDPADPQALSLNLAIERVANVPKRAMGPKFFEQLQMEAADRGINELAVMANPQTMSPASARKAREFASLIDELKADLARDGLGEIVHHILQKTGYEAMLLEKEELGRLDNVHELENDIRKALEEDPNLELESYLQDIALFADHAQEEADDHVNLMTIHAAKGTEYDVVFIGGVNEGVFPSSRALLEDPDNMEEERRLMYVAMTRARRHLILTWNTGYSFQSQSNKMPSPFLREIPSSGRGKQKKNGLFSPKARGRSRTGKIRPGGMVSHAKFGQGLVLSVNGEIITVFFEEAGQKRIKQDYLTPDPA